MPTKKKAGSTRTESEMVFYDTVGLLQDKGILPKEAWFRQDNGHVAGTTDDHRSRDLEVEWKSGYHIRATVTKWIAEVWYIAELHISVPGVPTRGGPFDGDPPRSQGFNLMPSQSVYAFLELIRRMPNQK